jgi:Amt family ammonium transporter
MPALLIGLAAGVICYYGVTVKNRFGFDDSLDAVGVHGVGGTFGALATGLFASKAINAGGADGLFNGNASLVGTQLISVGTVILYAFTVSWVLLKILDKAFGLRVSHENELEGLDLSQHGESGYIF